VFRGGDTLLLRTSDGEGGQPWAHLHLILLDVETDTDSTILVNIETLRNRRQDQTTILEVGEHEFITRRSCVLYRRARIMEGASLRRLVERGDAVLRTALRPEVLERVRQGILRSRRTPDEVREFDVTNFMYKRG